MTPAERDEGARLFNCTHNAGLGDWLWKHRADLIAAAQSEPQGVPVAWRWRAKGSSGWRFDDGAKWRPTNKDEGLEWEPLYAAPPATPDKVSGEPAFEPTEYCDLCGMHKTATVCTLDDCPHASPPAPAAGSPAAGERCPHGSTSIICSRCDAELIEKCEPPTPDDGRSDAESPPTNCGEVLQSLDAILEHDCCTPEYLQDVREAAAALRELLDENARLTPLANLNKRDGNFLDWLGCCKVCDGEIPDGHTDNCDIWKLEKRHLDFIANEYNTAESSLSLAVGLLRETKAYLFAGDLDKRVDAFLAERSPAKTGSGNDA